MKIPKQIAVIVVLVLLFLLSPVALLAQTGTNDWSRLRALAGRTKLSVKTKGREENRGNVYESFRRLALVDSKEYGQRDSTRRSCKCSRAH